MKQLNTSNKQQGAIIVLVALSLVVLLGIGGLAIDMAHAYVNKTRQQNLADALALSAAISLNKGESSTIAETYSRTITFPTFQNSAGNIELKGTTSSTGISGLQYQFSTALTGPWATGLVPDATFARVIISPQVISTFLASIIGFDEISISSTAVAGAQPIVPCDLAPIMMCADMNATKTAAKDLNCEDDTNHKYNTAGALIDSPDCYGYEVNALYCMKEDGGTPDPLCPEPADSIGAGNFGFVDLDSVFDLPWGKGVALKYCMAGDPECTLTCELPVNEATGLTEIHSKSGQNFGLVEKGINTRFAIYPNSGDLDTYPSDHIVTHTDSIADIGTETDSKVQIVGSETALTTTFEQYQELQDIPHIDSSVIIGQKDRRVLSVPFVDCSDGISGTSTPLNVVGYGCFFLAREMANISNDPYIPNTITPSKKYIYGIFTGTTAGIKSCDAAGDSTSVSDFGFYKVVLYKDYQAEHS